MKTRIQLMIIFLAMTFTAAAQEPRYIETTVSDTVKLNPLSFTYEISLSSESYSFDYSALLGIDDTSKSVNMTDVLSLLKKEKFTLSTDVYSGYMDWIKELSSVSSYDLFGLNKHLYKVFTRKLSFRFELK